MLKIKSLNKQFGKRVVLENLSVEFGSGVYGLLGPNGAGKTTLMRFITQLYPDKQNAIFYNDVPIKKLPHYLDNVGYLPQHFGLFKELTVYEMLQLMGNYKGLTKAQAKPMIEKSLRLVNLEDRSKSKVGTLSGGMTRRLGIAQAILNDPDIIIFDEPTTGLDPEERLRFKNLIGEIKGDRTIIISTHIVEDVDAVCDFIAVIGGKTIAACGAPHEIQSYADGKVYLLPENHPEALNKANYIVKRTEVNGEVFLRLLTGGPIQAEPVNPTVEDGYLCIAKGI